jgi:peptide/nickel transport system ATP-binding protein
LFADARHPYTEALMASIPRIDDPSHRRLEAIPGRPPELIAPVTHCAYAPRCRYARPDCLESVPELTDMAGFHRFACYHPAGTDRGSAALQANEDAGVTAAGLTMTAHREEAG